jgi:hypothetical protein
MQKITIADFSGGIQESYSPDDFTNRQWAQLKGVVPRDATTFESQWPAQQLSPDSNWQSVFPLESSVGTFLIAIKNTGSIWWCKVPSVGASYTVTAQTAWYQLTTAENKGINRPGGIYEVVADPADQPTIDLPNNPSFRFITGLPFEAYKYTKQPFPGRDTDIFQDRIFDSLVDVNGDGTYETSTTDTSSRSVCPGVLIGFRRAYRKIGSKVEFGVWDSTGAAIPPENQRIIIAYVDPRGLSADLIGSGETPGVVKFVSFPHFRRWPEAQLFSGTLGTWPAITVAGISYASAPLKVGIRARYSTPSTPINTLEDEPLVYRYPYVAGAANGLPGPITSFHPYTYLDRDSTLLPGNGIIPRGNVGTMWGNQLILGDIEWRSDSALTADTTKITLGADQALVGTPGLTDGNTEPHRGSFYYSEADIDEFDTRSVLRASASDARIAGMYMLDNRLICVTTSGGGNDGVVSFSGNLGQLHPYSSAIAQNPFAVRRQLIRGGVGVADTPDDGAYYGSQTCLWSEAGLVVFVDSLGGVFYTDGQVCDRLDRYGPRQPSTSGYSDHVAAVGKHLLVWRSGRLLLMTLLESNGESASGCWTELVPPNNPTVPGHIKSMIGSGRQVFMVVKGQIWRYAVDGTDAERGRANNVELPITVSTQTIGDPTGHKKTNWYRVGLSFFTAQTARLDSVVVRGEAALVSASPTPTPNPSPVPSYQISPNNTYVNGHYDFVSPAGIGPQTVMSATYTLYGNVVLKSFSVWGVGGVMERGEK